MCRRQVAQTVSHVMLDHMSSSGVMHRDGRQRGGEKGEHEVKKKHIAAVHTRYRNTDALAKNIISKHNPQTWHEWENMVHAKHDVWLRLSSLYLKKPERTKFGRTKSEWHRSFKPKGQSHGKESGEVVPC